MGEDSFKTTIFALLLVSIFGMAILTATFQVASNYEVDANNLLGGSLSIEKFNQSVSSIEENAKAMNTAFSKRSIWSAIAGVVVEGIFGIAKDMIDLVLSSFDIVLDILSDVLKIPEWVTSALLGLFMLSVIFSIWRLLKIGD